MGLNRTQEYLIALTDLQTALKGFVLVPEQEAAYQRAQVALNLERDFKKPSVFFQGSQFSASKSYNPNPSGDAAQVWLNTTFATQVKVFNIQDADRVDVNFYFSLGDGDDALVIGYMLSIDPFPITLDQASLLGGGETIGSTPVDAKNGYQFSSDSIPCSGYQYLHIFGGNEEQGDMFSSYLAAGSSSLLTFRLVK